MNRKRCPYCTSYRLEEDMRYEWRGRGGRNKTPICVTCQEGRKRNRTVADRDKFGKQVTEENRLAQSHLMRNLK